MTTWYSPYYKYSAQTQYLNNYGFLPYYSTAYATMTGGQFQNNYYAFDGTRKRDVAKGGFKFVFGLLRLGMGVANLVSGGMIPSLGSGEV